MPASWWRHASSSICGEARGRMPASISGPRRARSTTRCPAIESRMRWRSASVSSSVEPRMRNLTFAHRSFASWRFERSPRWYAARPKWIALEPSMRVLSRSKKAAAPGTPSRLLAAVGEQLARGSSADWAREEVALRELAAERPQAVGLLLGLDALGNHVNAQRAPHRQDGGHDGLVLAGADDAVDERAVDLERVDREAPHIGERRVAGAEVVECEAHAQLLEAVERGQRGRGVLDESALGDLDAQEVGGKAGALERLDDRLDRARMAELAWREVHGHAQRRPPRPAPR